MWEADLAQESAVSLSGILPRPEIQASTKPQSKSLLHVKYNYKLNLIRFGIKSEGSLKSERETWTILRPLSKEVYANALINIAGSAKTKSTL